MSLKNLGVILLGLVMLGGHPVLAQPLNADDYNLQVNYVFLLNQGSPLMYQSELYLSSESSLFSYRLAKEEEEIDHIAPLSSPLDEQSYEYQIMDTTSYYIWSDLNGSEVLHLEQIPGKKFLYLVSESMPDIDWKHSGNHKMIQEYTCYEATGYFGGRHYTVWYTDQLPANFGPWKFHGLPGLVMEVEDQMQEVQFYVKTIRSLSVAEQPLNPLQHGSYQIIDRETYIEELKQYFKSLEKRMASRVGRGFEVKVRSTPIRSIEIYDY